MESEMVMDLIFDGQIYPSEDIVPQSAEYWESNRKVDELCGKLMEKLGSKDYELVEELCNQKAAMENILYREYFKYGLSLGLRLMQEAETLPYITLRRNIPND